MLITSIGIHIEASPLARLKISDVHNWLNSGLLDPTDLRGIGTHHSFAPTGHRRTPVGYAKDFDSRLINAIFDRICRKIANYSG